MRKILIKELLRNVLYLSCIVFIVLCFFAQPTFAFNLDKVNPFSRIYKIHKWNDRHGYLIKFQLSNLGFPQYKYGVYPTTYYETHLCFTVSVSNYTSVKLAYALIKLTIYNKNNREVLHQNIQLPINIYPTISGTFYMVFANFGIQNFIEDIIKAKYQLGTQGSWGYKLIGFVPDELVGDTATVDGFILARLVDSHISQ